MAISTNGAILTRVTSALYGEYLSNASYTELKDTAPATAAANFLTNDFAGKTDLQVANTILTNLGLTSITGLNNWLSAQLTAAGSTAAAKGAKLVSILNDYANLTSDATYGSYATSFNAKVEAGLIKSQTAGAKGGAYATADVVAVTNATLALTTGVDTTLVGGAGDDTFNSTNTASSTTLTAGDSLVGGAGTDTLQVTTTAAADLGASAFGSSVEKAVATATGGALTLRLDGFTDVDSVTSQGSTENVTFQGLATRIPTINVTGTNKDVTVTLANALTVGTTDAATINLNGAATTASSTVTVNGIENLTVNATGTSGSLDANGNIQSQVTVVSDSLKSLTLGGTGTERVKANLAGAGVGTTAAAATVTGSAGADDLEFSVPAAGKVSVAMGAGDDTVRVGTIAATTTIAGGDGSDTLVYSGTATVAAAAIANVTGFEKVVISGPGSVALATSDLTYTVAAGSTTYTGLAAGGTVNLQQGGSITLANTALTGAADAVTFNVGKSGSAGTGATAATIAAGEFDVVTVNAQAKSSTLTTDTAAYSVSGTTLNKVTLSAPHGATLSGGGAALTTIDASGVQGAFSSTATTSSTAALAITGGSGNDAITGGTKADVLVGNAGDDTITGGVGQDTLTGGTGNDVFAFAVNNGDTAVVSGSIAMDTITDFESGKDRLSFSQQNDKFVGNVANIQLGLAAMTAGNQSFFVTGENQVYVVATKGTLSQNDTVVKLTGVTALTSADVGAGTVATGGADITLTAANTFTQTALTTGGSAPTAANDTLRSTSLQFLENTDITGGNGVDTIAITAGAAASSLTAAEADGLLGFERMTLGENTVVGGASVTASIEWDDVNIPSGTFTFDATGLTTIASDFNGSAINGTGGGTGTLSLTGSNYALAGDTLVGGSFNDTINGGAGNDTITGGAGNDSLLGGLGDDTIVAAGTDIIDGGAGNDVVQVAGALGSSTTDLATIELGAGVNRINYTNNAGTTANATITATGGVYDILVTEAVATATMTPSQFAGAFQVIGVNGNAAEGITFSTNGTIDLTKTTDITNVNLSAGTSGTGANTVTAAAGTISITGAGGADTINVAGGASAVAILQGSIAGGAGTDTINVTGNTATTATMIASTTSIEAITFANTTANVVLTTNAANVADAATMSVTASSLTTGTLKFDGSAETGATSPYTVTSSSTGADTLIGGAGNDVFNAGNGANVFTGNAGNDSVTGGTGADTVYGDNGGTKQVSTVTIAGVGDTDFISGGTVTATIDGFAVTYTLTTANVSGNLAADVLAASTGLAAAINADANLAGIVSATNALGVVTLTFAADGVHTMAVSRAVTGTTDAAISTTNTTTGVAGTVGADTIIGGAGTDLILGGGGNDLLTGDAGIDTFYFLKPQSVLGSMATITDYRLATGNNAAALDKIVLGDQVTVAGTTATVQDLSSSASLGAALNSAANTNTTNVGLSVFMWGGDTYAYVETTGNGTTFVTTDFLVKITGTPFTTATAIAGLGFDGV